MPVLKKKTDWTLIPVEKQTRDNLKKVCELERYSYNGLIKKIIELYNYGEIDLNYDKEKDAK